MLKALMRVRLAAMRSWFTGMSRSKRKQTKAKTIGFAFLILYAAAAYAFMFYGYFSMISRPYYEAGLGWTYFSMFAVTDFALMFIGSIFTAKAQLYEAKDNELLLSMPIPPSAILGSRMLTLLLINLAFDLMMAVPAGIAWAQFCPVHVSGILAFVAITLLLPLFSLALSVLFAWLLSLLTRRIRRKSLFSTVFSLAFLGAYFVLVAQMQTMITKLAQSGTAVAERLGGVALLYWIGKSIADGDLLLLLFSAVCLVLPFVLAYWLISKTFIRTVTAKSGVAAVVYKETMQKVSGVSSALYQRELRRCLSSSAYIINAGFGAVVLAVGGVALPFLNIQEKVPLPGNLYSPILILTICMISGMTTITAASVSIEGNTLWVARSMPVSSADLLRAKLLLHLSVAGPATVIAEAGLILALKPSGTDLIWCLLTPLAFTGFTALAGLVANLHYPNLDWTNETQAVKNGASVLIALCVCWVTVLAMGGAGYGLARLMPMSMAMGIVTALLILVCRLLYRWILTGGVAAYERLG